MSVIPLNKNGIVPNSREPNADVVKELEDLLERAKAGEVAGVAIIILYPGDLTSWTWAGRMTRSLVGAMELCKLQFCAQELELT